MTEKQTYAARLAEIKAVSERARHECSDPINGLRNQMRIRLENELDWAIYVSTLQGKSRVSLAEIQSHLATFYMNVVHWQRQAAFTGNEVQSGTATQMRLWLDRGLPELKGQAEAKYGVSVGDLLG